MFSILFLKLHILPGCRLENEMHSKLLYLRLSTWNIWLHQATTVLLVKCTSWCMIMNLCTIAFSVAGWLPPSTPSILRSTRLECAVTERHRDVHLGSRWPHSIPFCTVWNVTNTWTWLYTPSLPVWLDVSHAFLDNQGGPCGFCQR